MKATWYWQPRTAPLAPFAVAARRAASAAMARRLLDRNDDALAQIRGVAGHETLLVLGPAEMLPWVDGAEYLGRDPLAPSLLLPTHSESSLNSALLERALLAAFPATPPPVAVLQSENLVLSANGARPISRTFLLDWLANSGAVKP